MAMHHFYKLSPGSVAHLEDDFRRALSDQDPGVMEAALVLFLDMAKVERKERERGGREREREGGREERGEGIKRKGRGERGGGGGVRGKKVNL